MAGPVTLPTLSVTAEAPSAKAKPAPSGDKSGSGGITFHEVLSSLNPLQYVPVVGTLYRAVTGDTIPEANRVAGSFVFSGLTGGPVGLATSALTTLLEKVTGFDPDQIGRTVLAKLGLGSAPSGRTEAADQPPAASARAAMAEPATTGAPPPAGVAVAATAARVTAAQGAAPQGVTRTAVLVALPTATAAAAHPSSRDLLTAYGLPASPAAARALTADALNGMELSRIASVNGTAVAAAYAGSRPAA